MKNSVALAACLAMVTAITVMPVRAENAAIGLALQRALDEALPGSGAVGVSAAAVFADGRTWAGTAGISHPGVPLTTDMLFDIATDPSARGRGHARRLVRGLMGWARGKGAMQAYLQVTVGNDAARALYDSLGYKESYRYNYRLPSSAEAHQ